MKLTATIPALMVLGAIIALPLHAQYDMPDQSQAPPPNNGAYAPAPQQAPPPPNQQGGPGPDQGAPDQGGPDQGGMDQGTPDQDAPDQGAPDQSASFQTFYDNLSSQGTWCQSSDYGYVWQPHVSDPGWAPYTEGHWVYSDAGWTWASHEPWGWATYHYGRWVNLEANGWCWVPGYRWAPAWVSWRYGGGYCGWAPLPPDSFVGIDYGGHGLNVSLGFHIGGDCDFYYGIGAGCYHFIPCTYLGERDYRGHYADRYDNYALINRTTNVTNLNVGRGGTNERNGNFGRVTIGGPSFAQINAVSQTPVQHVVLTHAARPGEGGLSNNSFALYAPHVGAGSPGQPHHVEGSIGNATINRGVDINHPLYVNRNLEAPKPTPGQVEAAQLAQFNAPPHAKVVTASTPMTPILNTPLSNMRPVGMPEPSHTQGAVVNTNQHVSPSVQPLHPVANIPSNVQENEVHGANSQPRSFYDVTHPSNTAANNPYGHSQEAESNSQSGMHTAYTQPNYGSSGQQQQHSVSNTAVTPVHTQSASAPVVHTQSAPAPTVTHTSQQSSPPPQQSSPPPSSNSSSSSSQGGNGGGWSNRPH